MTARPSICEPCCPTDCVPVTGWGSLTDWTEATWTSSPVAVDFKLIGATLDLSNQSVDRQVASGALYRVTPVDNCIMWSASPFDLGTASEEVGLYLDGLVRLWITDGVWQYSGSTNVGESAAGPSGALGPLPVGFQSRQATIFAEDTGSGIEISIWINGGIPGLADCDAKYTITGTLGPFIRFGVFAKHGGQWTGATMRCNCIPCPAEGPDGPFIPDCSAYDLGLTWGRVGSKCEASGGACDRATTRYQIRGVNIGALPAVALLDFGIFTHVDDGGDVWESGENVMDLGTGTIVFDSDHPDYLTKTAVIDSLDCLGVSTAQGEAILADDPIVGTDSLCRCPTKTEVYEYCIAALADTMVTCSGGTCIRCEMERDMTVTVGPGPDPPPPPGSVMALLLANAQGSHLLIGAYSNCSWTLPATPGLHIHITGSPATPKLRISTSPVVGPGEVLYSAPGLSCDGLTTWSKISEQATPTEPTDFFPATVTSVPTVG